MEEELPYSTIVFRTINASPCDSITTKDVMMMSEEPIGCQDLITSDSITTKDGRNEELSGGQDLITSGNKSEYQALLALLGLLSLLLLSTVVYLALHRYPAGSLERELERRVESLKRERDAFNRTINVITGMDNFPVKEYCQKKVCKPCRKGWLFFGSSCYSFNFKWKEWINSQKSCQNSEAQLVTIQTQEEQEFIANRTEQYSYSNGRGYWMGGRKKGGQWTWEDGSKLTTTWVDGSPPSGDCLLSINQTDQPAVWSPAECGIKNRWICESPALFVTV